MKMRTRFRKGWRKSHRYHYVVANGSSGYAYDLIDLQLKLGLYERRGQEVAVFRLKSKQWVGRMSSRDGS